MNDEYNQTILNYDIWPQVPLSVLCDRGKSENLETGAEQSSCDRNFYTTCNNYYFYFIK